MRRYVSESIRKMREAQGMSVEQVCKLTGLTPERLKAYEEGSSVPPIGVMISLSRVLGSKMERLLHGGGVVSETLTICRNGESLAGIQGSTEQSYAYASLTRPGTAGHLMEPFLLDFDPATPPGPEITHEGQEFVYIVSGSVELFYDGQRHLLNQGDSAYVDSSRPHTFHGKGDTVAKMLAVVTSP